MAGEDQVERPGGHPPGDPGEVAEQHCEGVSGVEKLLRRERASPVALGIDAHDADAFPSDLQRLAGVAKEHRAVQVPQLGRARERIVRNGDIVVPEHDVRRSRRREATAADLAPGMRHEVAGHADDVRLSAPDPGDGPFSRAIPTREPRAEVEVGEVPDPDAVERLGKPGIATSRTRVRSQPASNQP